MAQQEIHQEELHVERTTPQGTQDHGVERGHENRDVQVGALMRWMTALAVMMILIFVSMAGMFAALNSYETRLDAMPSPMYAERAGIPADQPRLFPNPSQGRSDPHTPWEVGEAERARQNQEMIPTGLTADISPQPGMPMEPPMPVGTTVQAEDGHFASMLPANAESMVADDQPAPGADAAATPAAPSGTTANGAGPGQELANGATEEAPGFDEKPSYSSGGLRMEGKSR